MMKFGNSCQRPDVLRIQFDGVPDDLHFSVVPFESLVMILLPRRHLTLLLRNLFKYAFNAIQPLAIAVGHSYPLA